MASRSQLTSYASVYTPFVTAPLMVAVWASPKRLEIPMLDLMDHGLKAKIILKTVTFLRHSLRTLSFIRTYLPHLKNKYIKF